MKLWKTKVWSPLDLILLKCSCLVFGIVFGALFADFVMDHLWSLLAVAVLLAIKPAVSYFRD